MSASSTACLRLVILTALSCTPLLARADAAGGAREPCSAGPKPASAREIPGHGLSIFVSPADPGPRYTGCQTMWLEDGTHLATTYYKVGVAEWAKGTEPHEGKFTCRYRGGKLLRAQSSPTCPAPARPLSLPMAASAAPAADTEDIAAASCTVIMGREQAPAERAREKTLRWQERLTPSIPLVAWQPQETAAGIAQLDQLAAEGYEEAHYRLAWFYMQKVQSKPDAERAIAHLKQIKGERSGAAAILMAVIRARGAPGMPPDRAAAQAGFATIYACLDRQSVAYAAATPATQNDVSRHMENTMRWYENGALLVHFSKELGLPLSDPAPK